MYTTWIHTYMPDMHTYTNTQGATRGTCCLCASIINTRKAKGPNQKKRTKLSCPRQKKRQSTYFKCWNGPNKVCTNTCTLCTHVSSTHINQTYSHTWCVHTHIHTAHKLFTHTHIYVHTYGVYPYIYTYIHTNTCIYVLHTCINARIHTHIHTRMHTHT
jgi:hypothetical protein